MQVLLNRSFATNDDMVQNPPYWRASLLLFPHWDTKTKASLTCDQASLIFFVAAGRYA